MGLITKNTALSEIASVSRNFEKLSKWLFLNSFRPDETTLSQKYGEAQAELIAEALNIWEDEALTGTPVSANLYTRDEITKESDKGRSHLFFMPGEAGAPWVVICPGGAYASTQLLVEGFAPALELNRLGYHAFILCYRTAQHGLMPKPMDDLAAAIRKIRAMSERYHVQRDAYAVLGFSSGGHLAGEWGTAELGYRRYSLPAPQALLLAYPGSSTVLTLDALENGKGSPKLNRLYLNMILGREWSEDALHQYSVEEHVGTGFPPTYLIHCLDDNTATPENSRRLSAALSARGIPCKLRMPAEGGHGFGTGVGTPMEAWLEEACGFWQGQIGQGS